MEKPKTHLKTRIQTSIKIVCKRVDPSMQPPTCIQPPNNTAGKQFYTMNGSTRNTTTKQERYIFNQGHKTQVKNKELYIFFYLYQLDLQKQEQAIIKFIQTVQCNQQKIAMTTNSYKEALKIFNSLSEEEKWQVCPKHGIYIDSKFLLYRYVIPNKAFIDFISK